MKKAVVVDTNYGSVSREEQEWIRDKLSNHGIELELYDCHGEDEIIARAQNADMVLGTGNPPITEKVLSSLPNCRAVLRFGIGVNSVDLKAAVKYRKAVLYMPGFCVNELAVHAASMILALNRNLVYYDSHIRKGEWPKAKSFVPRTPGHMVLGLIGFGGSAKELYKIFHFGFGSKVLAYDPYVPDEAKKEYEAEFVPFERLLADSDIVSLHIPLTEETRHMINASAFAQMKSDSILINVSRGGLIDEQALICALDQKEIRFAGLDVFEHEPLGKDSPLLGRDDVVLSCHSAFYGKESKDRQIRWAYEMTRDLLSEGIIQRRRVANPEVLPLIQNQYSIQ